MGSRSCGGGCCSSVFGSRSCGGGCCSSVFGSRSCGGGGGGGACPIDTAWAIHL